MAGLNSLAPYRKYLDLSEDDSPLRDQPSTAVDPLAVAMSMMGQPSGMGGGGGTPVNGLDGLLWQVPNHYDHLHFARDRGIVPLGRKLQRMGFDVGEHPAFGGVDPVHTSGSQHYEGDAIDVNYYGGGRWANETQALNWLSRWLNRKYG